MYYAWDQDETHRAKWMKLWRSTVGQRPGVFESLRDRETLIRELDNIPLGWVEYFLLQEWKRPSPYWEEWMITDPAVRSKIVVRAIKNCRYAREQRRQREIIEAGARAREQERQTAEKRDREEARQRQEAERIQVVEEPTGWQPRPQIIRRPQVVIQRPPVTQAIPPREPTAEKGVLVKQRPKFDW